MRSERLLLVDDEPANTRLLERLLSRWEFEHVASTNDSTAALALYAEFAPDLVLLDLHMPDPNGFELLQQMIAHSPAGDVPVPILVLTADITEQAKHEALARGAGDFLTKPFDAIEVQLRISNMLETRRLQSALRRHGEEMERRVAERTRDLDQARRETLTKLARAAEFRDDDTGEHIHRVARTTGLLAECVGTPAQEVEILCQAAPLHDVGKIGISDTILLKPGRLTADEFREMQRHAEFGAKILEGSGSPVLRAASTIALTHHERWDGTGYPYGLRGEAIPRAGRFVAIADVFDALVSERPYKDAWTVEDAVAEILSQGGKHFDPELVDAFAELDPHALVA